MASCTFKTIKYSDHKPGLIGFLEGKEVNSASLECYLILWVVVM